MKQSLIALLVASFLGAAAASLPEAHAQDPKAPRVPPASTEPKKTPPTQQATKTTPKVLDFDGDVIEGQKKTPELFLQTEVERPTLDTVLYQRKNFNDFHGADSKRRPRASDPPR